MRTCISTSMLKMQRWIGTDFIAGRPVEASGSLDRGVHRALNATGCCCCPTSVKASIGILPCNAVLLLLPGDTQQFAAHIASLDCLSHQHWHLSRDCATWMGKSFFNPSYWWWTELHQTTSPVGKPSQLQLLVRCCFLFTSQLYPFSGIPLALG